MNNYSHPAIMALDFEYVRNEKNTSFDNFHVLFLLAYVVAIPVILFFVSQCIRCLRRRGVVIVSENSEECILDECHRHMNRGLGVVINPANRATGLLINSSSIL